LKFAGIIFTDGKKILLVRRADGDQKGKWDIPGGKIEAQEKALAAAKRESEEEVGSVKGKKVYEFKNPSVYIFKVKSQFKASLSKEHSAYRWVSINDVDKYNLHPKFKNNWQEYCKKVRELTVPSSFREWITREESYGDCRIELA